MKKLLIFIITLIALFPSNVSAEEYKTYKVASGDTMWRIAVAHEIGVSELIEANPQIHNPDLIYPNQTINIPIIDAVKRLEHDVIELTNQIRQQNGLQPLRPEWETSRVARYKSRDMAENNYFSHTSPTYGSPFEMLSDFGVYFNGAGENIAGGQRTPQEVVNQWMNSEGHRRNILNGNYTHIGVGYHQGGQYGVYWTQMFLTR
ncbi:CAP domain-containing protein [Bacillus shivajii]|uniref:CAP domain-containing protein n=1 Tax=Bacillus shivajii TaxID=1983719 RepID=UPI001CF9EB91|nr:CAP domain-containing protein [Bacillus shivajii]UCZ53262.1 CAP domain-containing protein [Bacillus shivajii]